MKNIWPEMRIMIAMNVTYLDQDIPDIYLCSMYYYSDSMAIRCKKIIQNILELKENIVKITNIKE